MSGREVDSDETLFSGLNNEEPAKHYGRGVLLLESEMREPGAWLNRFQVQKKLSVEQLAQQFGRTPDEIRNALLARTAPIEWMHERQRRIARASRLKLLRQRQAARKVEDER